MWLGRLRKSKSMDGQTCGEEGFEAMEEASGKNEATNVIPEADGDPVGE